LNKSGHKVLCIGRTALDPVEKYSPKKKRRGYARHKGCRESPKKEKESQSAIKKAITFITDREDKDGQKNLAGRGGRCCKSNQTSKRDISKEHQGRKATQR